MLDRLRRHARGRETTPSGLAQQLVDEGLRAREFRGIAFRDGPSGRRAALAGSLDVWEIVTGIRDAKTRGADAVAAAAVDLDLTPASVHIALAYYGAFPEEIDAEIADNERAAADALRSWKAQQRLIA